MNQLESLPPRVVRVLGLLQSALELDLLLLLHELPDQNWSPRALARILDADAARTRTALISLSRAGLVDRLYGGESICFRVSPFGRFAEAVDELAKLYLSCREPIVTAVEAQRRLPRTSR